MGNMNFEGKLEIKQSIRRWKKEEFGNMDHMIEKIELEIKRLDDRGNDKVLDEVELARRKALLVQFEKWLTRKERYWRHILRERFVKEGNRNSKYFHVVTNIKKKRRQILKIKIAGRMTMKQRVIKGGVTAFYKELYHKDRNPQIYIQEGLLNRISMEERNWLEEVPTVEEVRVAIWACELS